MLKIEPRWGADVSMAGKSWKDRFPTEEGGILAVTSSYGRMTRYTRDVACTLNSGCLLRWWHLKRRGPRRGQAL